MDVLYINPVVDGQPSSYYEEMEHVHSLGRWTCASLTRIMNAALRRLPLGVLQLDPPFPHYPASSM